MPRFLSAEWVAACSDALAGLDLGSAELAHALSGSLAAEGGQFRISQVTTGAPPGDAEVRTSLVVADGVASMTLDDPAEPAPGAAIVLSYADAAALSRGELDPATALAEGRVRVRGDLSLLVAAQALLVAAAGRLAGLHAETTY